MLIFQFIPMFALIAYMAYMLYYFVIPTAYLRIMLYYAYKKYSGIDIRFADNWITIKLPGCGTVFGRSIDIDIPERLLEYTVCAEFRKLLKEIRKGAAAN